MWDLTTTGWWFCFVLFQIYLFIFVCFSESYLAMLSGYSWLCTQEYTPSSAQRTIRDAEEENCVHYVQSKCPIHCTMALWLDAFLCWARGTIRGVQGSWLCLGITPDGIWEHYGV